MDKKTYMAPLAEQLPLTDEQPLLTDSIGLLQFDEDGGSTVVDGSMEEVTDPATVLSRLLEGF